MRVDTDDAKALLGGAARDAFERGAAPALLDAFDGPIAAAVVAERAPAYVTLLVALLLLRREHEIEPLHDDVERFVAPAARAIEPGWDEQTLTRDLDQLEAWGCLERRAEPLRIRGYKDIRRERFRYRLTEDAVALLEWLEGRLQARIEGRTQDSRDLMIDVVGAVKELTRVVGQWHKGERGDEAPRRALHLVTSIDERAHAIGEELLGFRASMVAFASRPYDLGALRAILSWLERYVGVYLARIETLRAEIAARLDDLAAPRLERAVAELHLLASRERAEAPAAFRAAGVLRDPVELLGSQRAFFAERGRLVALCARIDESARAVLRKMHRHLRELERRSARIADLRACMGVLAARPAETPDPRFAVFANALVASAHARFAARRAAEAARLEPPMPRRHSALDNGRARQPLRAKRAPPEQARELRARRLAELRGWIDEQILASRNEVRLSEASPAGDATPRRWLDVARARHLDRGRDLARIAVSIADVEGTVSLGGAAQGLLAPDCIVVVQTNGSRRPT